MQDEGRFLQAIQIIETLTGQDPRDRIDCHWAPQIIWVDDLRVASTQRRDIFTDAQICKYVHYDQGQREEVPTYLNSTHLVHSIGKTMKDIKDLLAQPESKECLPSGSINPA